VGKEALVQRNQKITEEAKAILDAVTEETPLTDEQRARLAELDEELTRNESEITRIEEDEKRAQRFKESRAKWGGTQVAPPKEDPFDVNLRTADERALVSRAQRVLAEDKIGTEHLTDGQRSRVEKILRTKNRDSNGADVARLLLATENEHYRSAFPKLIAGRPDFTPDEVRAIDAVNLAARAMSIGTPSAGGYAVPVLLDPTIIWTDQGSPNDIFNMARVERITNDTWRGLTGTGMTWKWDGEAQPSDDNSPAIDQPEVETHRADGFIPYSIEVEMDWPSFASDMSTAMQRGYSELLARSLTLTAAGGNAPTGLVSALDADATTHVQVGTAGVIAPVDIYGIWAKLPMRWRRLSTVAWMANTTVEQVIRQFGAGADADANFTVRLNSEFINPLFNREFVENDFMAEAPSGPGTEALLVLGDFRQYLIAQRMGMSVERIQMLMDPATGRPTGQRGMVAYARLGADVLVPGAFKLLKNKSA